MTYLTGRDAIEYAESHGCLLNKYSDPIEEARTDVTPAEAEDIAREDAGLVWVEFEDCCGDTGNDLWCRTCGREQAGPERRVA